MNEYIEPIYEVLDERSDEIECHLLFVKQLVDSRATKLGRVENNAFIGIDDYEISRDLIKTLSATGYLLIYNLIEAVMTGALDAIHQQYKAEELTFSKLSCSLQKICLNNFNKAKLTNNEILSHGEHSLEHVMTWLGYDKNYLFSGNIDARVIKTQAKSYGFNVSQQSDGSALRDIREKRNLLAHGDISFSECGQSTAIDELIAVHEQTTVYLKAILDSINEFLVHKQYKAVCL